MHLNCPNLGYPTYTGISWRFRWKTIEPAEGEYNWGLIDKALQVTSNAGKKTMLRVTAGMFTPDWVYQAGARPFEFSNTDLAYPENFPNTAKMPIPWDEVYLAKWEEFIHAFGRRYKGNPHIYSIHMTGGGHITEMNLPKAHAKWQQAGYSDEKLIAAWKRIIDVYQKAFPNTPTNLNIGEPLGGNRSHVLKPVVSYALAIFPQKVYIQQNGLKADLPYEQSDQADHPRGFCRHRRRVSNTGRERVHGSTDWRSTNCPSERPGGSCELYRGLCQ